MESIDIPVCPGRKIRCCHKVGEGGELVVDVRIFESNGSDHFYGTLKGFPIQSAQFKAFLDAVTRLFNV